MEKEKIVAVFKAFSDVNRVEILALLKEGEMCGNEILEKMEISQSTLSHHMKILCESGIVSGRKEGKWTYYAISEDGGVIAKALLNEILDAETTGAEEKGKTMKIAPAKRTAKKDQEPKKAVKKNQEPKKTVKKSAAQEAAPQPQKPKRRQMDSWLL